MTSPLRAITIQTTDTTIDLLTAAISDALATTDAAGRPRYTLTQADTLTRLLTQLRRPIPAHPGERLTMDRTELNVALSSHPHSWPPTTPNLLNHTTDAQITHAAIAAADHIGDPFWDLWTRIADHTLDILTHTPDDNDTP